MINVVVVDWFYEVLEEVRGIDKVFDLSELNDEKFVLMIKFLFGVFVMVKELFVCKGFFYLVGFVDCKNMIVIKNVNVVENFLWVGVILIVVINCSELCMWWEIVNNVYGRINNFYDILKIVGGSFGGEGVIIFVVGLVCGVGFDVGKWIVGIILDVLKIVLL